MLFCVTSVEGLMSQKVSSIDQVERLFEEGNQRRAIAATRLNEISKLAISTSRYLFIYLFNDALG